MTFKTGENLMTLRNFVLPLVLAAALFAPAIAAAKPPVKAKSKITLEYSLDITVTDYFYGNVGSKKAPCVNGRKVKLFADGELVATTTSDGLIEPGYWQIDDNAYGDIQALVTRKRIDRKRRDVVCLPDRSPLRFIGVP